MCIVSLHNQMKYKMNRFFIAAICSIASGNLQITFIEKTFNSPHSLQQLSETLITAGNRASAAAAYPPDLLMNKMIAWAVGAFTAGLVLNLMLKKPNKWMNEVVIMFYLVAAYINIAIVPHPSWVAACVPALMTVPFMGGLRLNTYIQEIKEATLFKNIKDDQGSRQLKQPAL